MVLASPILTRFYDPHDFGLFGSFNAIVTTIIAASTLMFHQAIVIEEADRDSVTSTALCLSVATSFALASTGGALLLYGWLTSIFGPGVAVSLCWLGPISILAAALFVTLQSVCIRRQWFKPLALYQVVRSALVVIFQLSLWIIWPNLYGLIIGQLLGQVLALLVLARVWPFLVEAVSATRHLGAMRHIAVRYSHFAIYGAPQSVLNSLSGNVPTLLLTGFFGANETGLFWLAYRMLILPNQVLVESMRSVLFQRLNEVHLSGEVHAANDAKGGPPACYALRSNCSDPARLRTSLVCMGVRPELGTCGDRCADTRHILDAWQRIRTGVDWRSYSGSSAFLFLPGIDDARCAGNWDLHRSSSEQ